MNSFKSEMPTTRNISIIDYVLDTYLPLNQALTNIQKNIIPQYNEEKKECWVRVFSRNTGDFFLINSREIIDLASKNQVSNSKFEEFLSSLL